MKVMSDAVKFMPVRVTIILESPEEVEHFRHLMTCWDAREICTHREKLPEMARKIRSVID